MQSHKWVLGVDIVEEHYEYKNLGVFSSTIDDNIEKTQKKVDTIFSSNLDRHKINSLILCLILETGLPNLSLLYGAEVLALTPTLLTKFERCQSWLLKIEDFYVPIFAPNLLLQRLSGLNSIESEIAFRKQFLGRFITEPKMAHFVRSFMS